MTLLTILRLRRKHALAAVVAPTPDWDARFAAKAQEMERAGFRHIAHGGGKFRTGGLVLPRAQAWL